MLYRSNLPQTQPLYHLQRKMMRDTANDPSLTSKDFDLHVERLKNTDNYAVFSSTDVYDVLTTETCSIGAISQDKGERVPDGFSFRKNSAYAEEFDRVLAHIIQGKLDRTLRNKYFAKPKECSTAALKNVALDSIHGVFYMLFAGLAMAAIVFFAEYLSARLCGRYRSKTME